jgi:MYXO-CTERM domain-containing protein
VGDDGSRVADRECRLFAAQAGTRLSANFFAEHQRGRVYAVRCAKQIRNTGSKKAPTAVRYGRPSSKESSMSVQYPRNILRRRSINVGLVVSLGIFGCGESKQAQLDIEPQPNGTVGTLHVLLASFDDHAETIYRLRTDDGRDLGLNFQPGAVRPRGGQRIAVRGYQRDDEIEVSAYDLVQRRIGETQELLLTGASVPRTFRVAAISLDTSKSKATFAKRVFQDPDSPAAFYRDNSYGTWTLQGEAYGPYTIPTKTCGNSVLYQIASEAWAAAKADGFDVNNYDNVMYYMPASQGCSWGGVAEVGTNEARGFYNAAHSWYRGDGCVVLAQELGHNYGLLHSHTCTAPPYGNSASYGPPACGGTFSEYGDPTSPMGGGCGHFNSPEMGAMRYITGCNTLAVTNSGTFEIGPLEQKCAGPQVIQVPIPGSMVNKGPQYLYVEYRLGQGTVGSDSVTPKGLHFYASAEYGGAKTNIPADNRDLDYAVDPFRLRAPFNTAGMAYTEPQSGVTFTLMSSGATATVQVTVPNGMGDPTCVGGGTPPASPMCGIVTDAGPQPDTGTGGTGGGPGDASTDTGTGGTAGKAGAAGAGGTAGTAGTAGTGGAAGTGTAGTAGTGGAAGSGGTAGKGGAAGSGGSSGTGGSTGGAAGSGTGGSAGATGGSAGSSGSGGSGGGKGGTGGTGTGGSGGSTTGGSPPPDDGCSCSIPGGSGSTRTPALLLGLAALAPALRRRRRSS